MKKLKYLLFLALSCATQLVLAQGVVNVGSGGGVADSTRLVQDSILVYYQGGIEIGRDTISLAGIGADGSVTNEGALSVGAGAANTSQIITNTSGDGGVFLKAGTNISLSESADTITITSTGGGITSLNSQTGATQTFATGTTGSDFNISSSTNTHTFNIPTASELVDRGLVTNGSQTIAGAKTFNSGIRTISGNAAQNSIHPSASSALGIHFPGDSSLAVAANGAARLQVFPSGRIRLNNYGSTGYTGSATKWLAVNANGDIIQENAVSRPSGEIVYGTGTGITSDTKIKADGTGIRLTSINAESWPLRFINTNGPDGISIDYDNGSNTATNQDIGFIQFRPRFNNSLSNEVAAISATYTGTGTTRKGSLTLKSNESDGNFITGLSIEGLIAYLQPNGGKVGIGTTTPARTLHVTGEARITDLTTDNPTQIVGADADGDLAQVKLGTGLSLSNDTLNASVSATIDTVYISVNVLRSITQLPAAATVMADDFFTVPASMDGWHIRHIQASVFELAAAAGTYEVRGRKLDVARTGATAFGTCAINSGAGAGATVNVTVAENEILHGVVLTNTDTGNAPVGVSITYMLTRN